MENSLKVPLAETFRIDKCKGEAFVRNWKDCILIEIKLRKDFKWKRTKWLLNWWKDQETNQKKIMFLEYLWQKQNSIWKKIMRNMLLKKRKLRKKFNKNKENFNKNKEKSLKQKREQWKFNWAKVMTIMVCLLMIQRYLYNH